MTHLPYVIDTLYNTTIINCVVNYNWKLVQITRPTLIFFCLSQMFFDCFHQRLSLIKSKMSKMSILNSYLELNQNSKVRAVLKSWGSVDFKMCWNIPMFFNLFVKTIILWNHSSEQRMLYLRPHQKWAFWCQKRSRSPKKR